MFASLNGYCHAVVNEEKKRLFLMTNSLLRILSKELHDQTMTRQQRKTRTFHCNSACRMRQKNASRRNSFVGRRISETVNYVGDRVTRRKKLMIMVIYVAEYDEKNCDTANKIQKRTPVR